MSERTERDWILTDYQTASNETLLEGIGWQRELISELEGNIKKAQFWLTKYQRELDRRALAALFDKHGGIPVKEDDWLIVTTQHDKFSVGTECYIKPMWSWKNLDTSEPLICVSSGIIEYVPLKVVQQWRVAYLDREAEGKSK